VGCLAASPLKPLLVKTILILGTIVFALVQTAREPRAEGIPSDGANPHSLSVLFVGNSLTYVNDLPHLTQEFAASSRLHASLVVWSAVGEGAHLADHWRKGEATRLLRSHRPDVLVLQAQGTEPLSARDDFLHYCELMKAEADKVGARTILFETWARPPGDVFYAQSESGGSPPAMQVRLRDTYEWTAHRLGAEVAPVGQAFEIAMTRLPDVPLLDGTQHPTLAGSYLAAAVLFQSLFHSSPRDTQFTGGLAESSATALQGVALAVR
jgi:hypothetical protein